MGTQQIQQLLNVEEAAQRLDLHPQTLRAIIRRRELPHVRIGRAVKVSAAALADFIERHTQAAA
jgi:excisionase family DNA binding protein